MKVSSYMTVWGGMMKYIASVRSSQVNYYFLAILYHIEFVLNNVIEGASTKFY